MHIRKAKPSDRELLWPILQEVIATGETYVFAPDTPKEQMMDYWLLPHHHVFVAVIDNTLVGTYIMQDNQPGLGSHIANASYMVSSSFRGQGVGWALGQHSIEEGKRLGYHAIQFNIVISTNTPAVRLWQKLGFEIIGTTPEGYRHSTRGLVDSYVMYRQL